jgi:hypothetical protein
LKLKYVEPLSKFALKFNLRRYKVEDAAAAVEAELIADAHMVGRCRLTLWHPS